MFIEKDESEVNYSQASIANNIKVQINDCLDQAEKKPGMRKKILQSMSHLED